MSPFHHTGKVGSGIRPGSRRQFPNTPPPIAGLERFCELTTKSHDSVHSLSLTDGHMVYLVSFAQSFIHYSSIAAKMVRVNSVASVPGPPSFLAMYSRLTFDTPEKSGGQRSDIIYLQGRRRAWDRCYNNVQQTLYSRHRDLKILHIMENRCLVY